MPRLRVEAFLLHPIIGSVPIVLLRDLLPIIFQSFADVTAMLKALSSSLQLSGYFLFRDVAHRPLFSFVFHTSICFNINSLITIKSMVGRYFFIENFTQKFSRPTG